MTNTNPISRQEADQAIREMGQIAFGLMNSIPGLPRREKNEPPIYSKDKQGQARTLYQLARENGDINKNGDYVYKGMDYEIEAKDPKNVRVEKKGKVVFRMDRGVLHENSFKARDGYGLEANLKESIKERNAEERASRLAEQEKPASQEKGEQKKTSTARTRNPHQLAKSLHELNLENGKKGKNDIYEFEGENYTIRSRSSGNVSLTRKGEDTPAFKVSGGRVKANSLKKEEVAAIHKNLEVQRNRGKGIER